MSTFAMQATAEIVSMSTFAMQAAAEIVSILPQTFLQSASICFNVYMIYVQYTLGFCALVAAVAYMLINMARWLHPYEPLWEANDWLIAAVLADNAGAVKIALKQGADINRGHPNGTSAHPIHYAVQLNCSIELLELLVESGAQLDARDQNGRTPLHYACMHGRLRAVKWLVEKLKAMGYLDLHLRDKVAYGGSPILEACLGSAENLHGSGDQLAVVKFLHAQDPTLINANYEGRTLSDAVCQFKAKEVANWLKKHQRSQPALLEKLQQDDVLETECSDVLEKVLGYIVGTCDVFCIRGACRRFRRFFQKQTGPTPDQGVTHRRGRLLWVLKTWWGKRHPQWPEHFTPQTIFQIASSGNQEQFRWAIERTMGFPGCVPRTCALAADEIDRIFIELVQGAFGIQVVQSAPLHRSLTMKANCRECLQYLFDTMGSHTWTNPRIRCVCATVGAGTMDLIEFFIKHGYQWPPPRAWGLDITQTACTHDELEILKYLLESGCAWNHDLCVRSAIAGNMMRLPSGSSTEEAMTRSKICRWLLSSTPTPTAKECEVPGPMSLVVLPNGEQAAALQWVDANGEAHVEILSTALLE